MKNRVAVLSLVVVVLFCTGCAGLPAAEQSDDSSLLQMEKTKTHAKAHAKAHAKGIFDFLSPGTKPSTGASTNVGKVGELVASGKWSKILEVGDKAQKIYKFANTAQDISEAAYAAATAETDGEKLAALGKFLKVASDFVPEPLKPIEKFLEFYAEACEQAGKQIDQIMKTLEVKERDQKCIFRPGVMSGGWGIYNWFYKACMGETLPQMDSDMRKILKDNRAKLKKLTGTDPVKYNYLIVFDDDYARDWVSKAENWMVLQLMVWGFATDGTPMCACARPEPNWNCPFCPEAPSSVRQNPKLQ